MSTNIHFGTTLNFDEASTLIALCPELKVNLEGEPGIGKTATLSAVAKKANITRTCYIDAAQYSTGDGAMPAINHQTRTSGFYPNEHFGLHYGEPVVIMIDEFSKASQSVQNELHTLLEEKPRFYGTPLPEGSIVYSTGNMGAHGVGDKTKDHTINRQTRVVQRKPTADEWIHNFAVNAGVEGSLIAFVKEVPQVMASYMDEGQEDNQYIFNPRRPGRSFFSPRSAAKSSNIIRRRRELGPNATTAGLIGTIGEAAARDLDAYIEFQNELPAWREIVDNPRSAHVPSSPGAVSVLVFGAVQKVEEDSIDAFMRYLERFDTTWQATFCLALAKSNKQKIGFRNSSYKTWLQENQDLL